MSKLGERKFCPDCGFEMSTRVWSQHVEGRLHQLSVKEGRLQKAQLEAQRLKTSGAFTDIRVGWFEIRAGNDKLPEIALIVVKDRYGALTILSVEGKFRMFLPEQKPDVKVLHEIAIGDNTL